MLPSWGCPMGEYIPEVFPRPVLGVVEHASQCCCHAFAREGCLELPGHEHRRDVSRVFCRLELRCGHKRTGEVGPVVETLE
jgi:hypothetical protein